MADIEDFGDANPTEEFPVKLIQFVTDLTKFDGTMDWKKFQLSLYRKHKFSAVPKRMDVSYAYGIMVRKGMVHQNKYVEENVVTCGTHHSSGVMVVTIATKPDKFSCKFNCFYCPNEPGQPRSYLSDEPVLERAISCGFDTVKQFYARANRLYRIENKLDKLEVIVIGGTWSCYEHEYQYEFVRDIYYASNIFYDMLDGKQCREKYDMSTEQTLNETAQCRIISVTLETRPDMITPEEIIRFREFGVTRVQLGVQHTDDNVLQAVNRRCYCADTIRAIKLLKDNGFKIDIHIMPNLPSTTSLNDIKMFERIINDPDLQVDQWKIYPCEVIPYSVIKEWYEKGTYIPYPEVSLKQVLEYALTNVPPWIRINRVIRDFQMIDVIAGIESSDLRVVVQKDMETRGIMTQDIRTREVKSKIFDRSNIKIVTRKYFSSGGIEYFISHENNDMSVLYSLLRLRINGIQNMCVFHELSDCSLIRELHVYGKMVEHNQKPNDRVTQHKGLGKELIAVAENISLECGYHKICVISGEGVKGYYKDIGFVETTGRYLIKKLT